MELGDNAAAAESFNRETTAPNASPEVVQQAWYQLGITYRRLHRIEDAQKAFAIFQRLKDEEAQKQQNRLNKKRQPTASDAPPNPQ